MTTMNVPNNGKVRHSLANEIDRLDRMLDGLAEGLNEAVADAVKAAVGTAVREAAQAVLTEVLTNPEIRARLNGTTAKADATITQSPQGTTKTGVRERLRNLWQGIRSCVAGLCFSCGARIRNLPGAVCSLGRKLVQGLLTMWSKRQAITQFKYQLLTAATIGTSVAIGAWFAGPHVSAFISGIGGFAASLGVQGWLWMRKAFGFNQEQMA